MVPRPGGGRLQGGAALSNTEKIGVFASAGRIDY